MRIRTKCIFKPNNNNCKTNKNNNSNNNNYTKILYMEKPRKK